MELIDTVDLMTSEYYQERMLAEYLQVKIRYEKLVAMLEKYKTGTLPFKPKCSYDLLKSQADYMAKYIECLEIRAKIEGVKLDEQ